MLTGARWRAGGDLRAAATRIGVVGLWVFAVAMALLSLYRSATGGGFGLDTHAYYLAGQRSDLYGWPGGSNYGYLYSPVFAQIIKPLTLLPWPVFEGLWIGAEVVAYAWLLWPLPLRWRALAYLYLVPALCLGNIFGALGVVLVLSMRQRPALWAFPLLTKVVPAGVGFVWYAARGEWRNLARIAAATVALVAVSAAFQPQLWVDWLRFLFGTSGRESWRLVQLPIAVALSAYAGRTNRVWLLAVAFCLTLTPPFYMQGWGALAPAVRLMSPRGNSFDAPAMLGEGRKVEFWA